jgi:LuxR family transcriptional regulator, maltose regulon positive regulatory protein
MTNRQPKPDLSIPCPAPPAFSDHRLPVGSRPGLPSPVGVADRIVGTDEGYDAELPALGLDRLLLETRLRVPEARPDAVSRAGLVERARSSGRRMVAITAPGGYGKTTFLAEWARMEDRRVAWVSLDRSDDEPDTLLRLLASAFGRLVPECADLASEVRGLGMSLLGRAAPRLAAAMSASSDPFVLMLDDLHELRSPACQDVLEVVIDGLPRGSQLVIASRSEQPLLPRLRAAGDAFEVGGADLALDQSAAIRIFAVEGVVLSPELAAEVTQRTEGWPAGLYLAAMIARDTPEHAGVISGVDRYVADYLYQESLSRLSAEEQWFLCASAVLEQLSGPLCDASLESSGGSDQLQRLEAASLFVVPLDRQRQWYRYHTLFREFLLGELRRRASDGEIEKLHLRATDWYEANASVSLAIEHLLQTAERDRSLQMVASSWLNTCSTGKLSTVLRWLTAIGPADIEGYPPLAVMAAWSAVLTGEPAQADRWAAFLESASFHSASSGGFACFDSARAVLRAAMCARGPEAMTADAAFAVAQEPAWGGHADIPLWLLGESHLMSGRVAEARDFFVRASEAAVSMGRPDMVVVSQSELAMLAMDEGDWHGGDGHLESAWQSMYENRLEDYLTSVLVFPQAARLALHRGDLQAARAELARAMQARPLATYGLPFVAVRLRLESAKLCLALADATTARHLLREIDDILARRPSLGVLVKQADDFRSVLRGGCVAATGPTPLTAAELRLLPYIQTHLTLGAIAQRLFVSRNTVSSQITSVYRKLGVSSRQEAVDRATALGLLGG